MFDVPRITLIARDPQLPSRAWKDAPPGARVMVFVDAKPFLKLNIINVLAEPTLDTERVIFDRAVTAEMYLELLASMPPSFSGDILRIDDRGSGFLSATGRGGDRVLYALQRDDVHFYLAAHALVHGNDCELLRRTA